MTIPVLQSSSAAVQDSASPTTADTPSGVTVGDLLILCGFSDYSSGSNINMAASGYTEITNCAVDVSSSHLWVGYRVATGSDSYVVTSDAGRVSVYALRIDGQAAGFDGSESAASNGSSANAVAPAATASGADNLVIRFGGLDKKAFSAVPDTLIVNTDYGDGTLALTQKDQAASGTTGTGTFTNPAEDWATATLIIDSDAATPPAAIHNLIQGSDLGADLYNGTLL